MAAIQYQPETLPSFTAWRKTVALMLAAYGLRAQFESVGEAEWASLYASGLEPADAVVAQETRLLN